MIPRYYQQAANDAAWNYLRNQSGNPLIVLPTGCHSAGHPILMANGSIKSVESVGVGDQLMGPDSKPRTVLRLCRGRDQMFLIKPIRGKAFLVNGDHVLHLECTNEGKGKYPSQKIGGEVDHITVREYLGKSKSWKHLRKLRQSDTVDFGQSVEFRIPPYIAGLMLGDGHMNKSISLTNMDQQAHDEFAEWVRSRGWDLTITTKPGNKAWTASIKTNERGKTSSAKTLFAEEGLLGKVLQFKSVPDKYLTASRLDRLELIAGLLDSDGYHDGKGGYEFSNRSEQLCNSLAFLCRSVGLRVTEKVTRKRSQLSDLRIYFRIHISGDTDQIPCRIPRNKAPSRRQIKNHLRFGFTVEPAYIDNFYGFTLSDDHLYLDGNFLIHHNSGKSLVISMLCRQALAYDARVMVLQHRKELIEQNAEKIQILMPDVKVGLNSAGLKRHAFDEPVICAGIQTVYRKAHEFGRRELIIVDEAHLINHKNDDSMYSQFIADIRSVNPTARVVGLTATPMRTGEGPICGKNKLFQKICYEAFTGDLIQQGYLCPITNKSADATIDTSSIQMRGGEFIQASMDQAFDVDDKVRAACAEILTRCQDRHSILVFASGVHHAESIADCLRQMTGERVGVVTGETIDLERRQYLTDFKNQRLRWMVNCDVLCLDEKTEILTSDGWIGIDDMTPRHKVAAWDMDGSIIFSEPKNIVRRPVCEHEKMVSLKTKGIDIRVTDNHRMVVWKGSEESGHWVIRQARQIVGKAIKMPAHGVADPFDLTINKERTSKKIIQSRIRSLSYVYRKRDGLDEKTARQTAQDEVNRRDSIKSVDPVSLTECECELIGFWIGDGSRSNGRFTISQSMAYEDNIAWIEEKLKECRIHYTKVVHSAASKTKHKSVRFCLSSGMGSKSQRRDGVARIEKYLNKKGTELLWGFSEKQFRCLLYGLWLADGLHHAKQQRNIITTTNKPLIDILQAVATCRGIRSTISKCSKPRSEKHNQQYKFSWSDAKTISVYKNRFRESEKRIGERAWCVTSETGNIITRRNGKVCVVGNTTGFDAPCIDAIAVLRATMSPGLFAQIVGRGLRKHDSKSDCLILDFGENIKRHGSLDDPNYGRSSAARGTRESSKAAEQNGRGKQCPNCELDVAANSRECPECGFFFPVNHDSRPDEDSTLTGQSPPEEFVIESVGWARHQKRDPNALPTVRIDYAVQPADGTGGNLSRKHISEWVCFEHEEFALTKAHQWWQLRSDADMPTSVDEALYFLDRKMARMPARLTARQEGKWWRIVSVEFDAEKPSEDEWLGEMEVDSEFDSSELEDIPF